MNFWTVAKTMPPDGRFASSVRSACRVVACTGCSRSRSCASENTPKSWPSRSLRSVMTTMVGFSICGACITRAAKHVMVMLFPLPWVCQTTPPLPRVRSSPSGREAAITCVMAARTAWNWW